MGKKSESAASSLVLKSLAKSSRTKKELKRVIKAKKPSLKKRTTRRALKNLLISGEIKKEGKEYFLVKEKTVRCSEKQIETDAAMIPIGMRLRAPKKKKKQVKFSDQQDVVSSGDNVDDEIERLERELMNGSDDDSDDSSSSDEEELDNANNNNTNNNAAILSLSEFADDRVESLASTSLPVPGRYDATKKRPSKNPKKSAEKRVLELKVQEILGGYTARSSEKLPFYCRFCSKQYDNEEDFYEHKTFEFHKTAVAMETKATFCKLCRKQFTSPVQMKEHLSSRPHKERLQKSRDGQRQSKKYC
jgi:hypothetical protein